MSSQHRTQTPSLLLSPFPPKSRELPIAHTTQPGKLPGCLRARVGYLLSLSGGQNLSDKHEATEAEDESNHWPDELEPVRVLHVEHL